MPQEPADQQPQPENPTWVSDIPPMRTIWKSLAKLKYRLDDEDLAGHSHDLKWINDERFTVTYRELIVQNIAWKRYGGPVEYWKKLKAELVAHQKEYRTTDGFRYPHDYQPGGRYDLHTPDPPVLPPEPQPQDEPAPAPAQDPPPDLYLSSKTLVRAKEELPAWLWNACNDALDADHGAPTQSRSSLRLRKSAMHAFMASYAAGYPQRPQTGLPRTPFTANFYRVLGNAPKAPDRGAENWGTPVPRLEYVGTPQDGYYEWCEAYLEDLFTQLCTLVSSFGLQENGWRTIRWTVYDKYVECLHRGLRYHPATKQWSDKAKCWLDEHQYQVGTEELRESLRDKCAAGRRFNDLFPIVID